MIAHAINLTNFAMVDLQDQLTWIIRINVGFFPDAQLVNDYETETTL